MARTKSYQTKTPEYKLWAGIKTRCYNEFSDLYHMYGAKGVIMAEEWLDNYPAFLKYIGPKPKDKYGLGRIDKNKGYEPGNVAWMTQKEINSTIRMCTLSKDTIAMIIELYDSQLYTKKAIAEYLGICRDTVAKYIKLEKEEKCTKT